MKGGKFVADVCAVSILLLLFMQSSFGQVREAAGARNLGQALAAGEEALNLIRMDFLAQLWVSPPPRFLGSDPNHDLYYTGTIKIPVGSTIKRIEMYAEDASTQNINVTLRSLSQTGIEKQWAFFSSYGNLSGIRLFQSSALNVQIKLWYAVFIHIKMPVSVIDKDRKVYLVRVIYTPAP